LLHWPSPLFLSLLSGIVVCYILNNNLGSAIVIYLQPRERERERERGVNISRKFFFKQDKSLAICILPVLRTADLKCVYG
jgi:hypothetical protein